jgi:hypothetical protein
VAALKQSRVGTSGSTAGAPLSLASRRRPRGHRGSCRRSCAPGSRGPAPSAWRDDKARTHGPEDTSGQRDCCVVVLGARGRWPRSSHSVHQTREDAQANGEEAVHKEAGATEERDAYCPPHRQVSARLTSLPSDIVARVSWLTSRCSLLMYNFGGRRQNQAHVDEPTLAPRCAWFVRIFSSTMQ